MCTHLRFNLKKTTQAINLLAIKSHGEINKIKAIKLIYFADRFHLRKYGRPITNDEYWAMEWGPVNSNVKDIADMSEYLGDMEREYASQYIESPSKNIVKSIHEVDRKVFSQTDIEALSWAWETFGHLDGFALADLSHHYPEWEKFKDIIESKTQTRVRMNYEDFFEDPGEGFEKCWDLSPEEKEDRLDMLFELDRISAYR
ncbi:MAG: Panacea domain-containing protein [Thermodesulfobacteriota bacterium]